MLIVMGMGMGVVFVSKMFGVSFLCFFLFDSIHSCFSVLRSVFFLQIWKCCKL